MIPGIFLPNYSFLKQGHLCYKKQNKTCKAEYMETLKGSQRKYLRAQAHHLKPLVMIGAKAVATKNRSNFEIRL